MDVWYKKLMDLMIEPILIDGKLTTLKDDLERFYNKNNKSAGKRVRKIMQMIRKECELVRKDIQDTKAKN